MKVINAEIAQQVSQIDLRIQQYEAKLAILANPSRLMFSGNEGFIEDNPICQFIPENVGRTTTFNLGFFFAQKDIEDADGGELRVANEIMQYSANELSAFYEQRILELKHERQKALGEIEEEEVKELPKQSKQQLSVYVSRHFERCQLLAVSVLNGTIENKDVPDFRESANVLRDNGVEVPDPRPHSHFLYKHTPGYFKLEWVVQDHSFPKGIITDAVFQDGILIECGMLIDGKRYTERNPNSEVWKEALNRKSILCGIADEMYLPY